MSDPSIHSPIHSISLSDSGNCAITESLDGADYIEESDNASSSVYSNILTHQSVSQLSLLLQQPLSLNSAAAVSSINK